MPLAGWDYLYQVPDDGSTPHAPPFGMRSSVPIGGLGTGGFELRADGSVHDWLVENQGPGLVHSLHRSSTWPGLKMDKQELLLGLRAAPSHAPSVAMTLRTSPPPGFPAAEQLTYSGAYPVAQLVVSDDRLQALGLRATLRAYAPFEVHDAATSNTPAVVFELEVTNIGLAPLEDVGFFVSLPALIERDSARTVVGEGGGTRVPNATTPAACRRACSTRQWCAAWTLDPTGGCSVAAANVTTPMPQFAEYHATGSWSGVRGDWAVPPANDTHGGLLVQKRGPGNYFEGEQNLRPILGLDGQQNSSQAVSDSLQELWDRFALDGVLGVDPRSGVAESLDGGYGAVVVSTPTLAPGETALLRMVLAWYHPNRYHFGPANLGNAYTNRFSGATDVAARTASRIDDVVLGIRRWHELTLSTDLSVDWRDFLVNSVAALSKTAMWFANGDWRQFESFSADDPDPVHIHLYRSLPYAALFPELDRSLLSGAYARWQNGTSGYVYENFPLGGQTALGRIMGDTSTAFILDVYHLWRGGGANRSCVETIWPNVRLAVEFQMGRSTEWGLPTRLTTTYDWFALEMYDVASYNAIMHLSALRAAAALGEDLGVDRNFLQAINAAATIAVDALQRLLWRNGTVTPTGQSYFAAGWTSTLPLARAAAASPTPDPAGGSPLLTDTLYGALWAALLGLDTGINREMLVAHLAAERRIQQSEYGLLVWWPQNASKADRGTNMVWNGGSFSHAALSLFLEGSSSLGLHEADKVIANYKHRIRDWWDFKDLNAGPNSSCVSTPTGTVDGQPWCNSHYTRQLIGWAVPLALSGQQLDMARRRLTFSVPGEGTPRRLPVFAAKAVGVLDTVQRHLTVLGGNLDGIDVRIGSHPVTVSYC